MFGFGSIAPVDPLCIGPENGPHVNWEVTGVLAYGALTRERKSDPEVLIWGMDGMDL